MKHKARMCEKLKCRECPLDCLKNGKNIGCIMFLTLYPQKAEEIIMKWAEEHPILTNAEMFKQVFGYERRFDISCGLQCSNEFKCGRCDLKGFWEREYKEPKGEE